MIPMLACGLCNFRALGLLFSSSGLASGFVEFRLLDYVFLTAFSLTFFLLSNMGYDGRTSRIKTCLCFGELIPGLLFLLLYIMDDG